MARNVIYADSAETVAEVRRLLEAHGIKVGRASAEADAAAAVEHGEARLVAVEAGTGLRDRDSVVEDIRAYEARREDFGREHAGRFIAIHGGEVVGTGESREMAARAGIEAVGRPVALFVIKAGDPLPEPVELDMHADTPRRVVGIE